MPNSNKVIGIVVTYHPDVVPLQRLISKLAPQVAEVVLVDNGSPDSLISEAMSDVVEICQWIRLGRNTGVARAQNVGIDWARAHGATHVVLFDQDSEPAGDMVLCLISAWRDLVVQGVRVASLGPRYMDKRQVNPPPFIQIRGLKLIRHVCSSESATVEVDYLISSGCLIPLSAFEAVGRMCEELFIDYVDIEWGLRAKTRGLRSFGVCNAQMAHALGDEPIKFLGRSLPLHSPLRHYYHFRNAIWLYKQNWLPLNWRLVDGYRLLLKYGFYSLIPKDRGRHFQMMTLGIWHGIRNRLGQFPQVRS